VTAAQVVEGLLRRGVAAQALAAEDGMPAPSALFDDEQPGAALPQVAHQRRPVGMEVKNNEIVTTIATSSVSQAHSLVPGPGFSPPSISTMRVKMYTPIMMPMV
jgi:hypothetical protein